jgi:hypothetical protein
VTGTAADENYRDGHCQDEIEIPHEFSSAGLDAAVVGQVGI